MFLSIDAWTANITSMFDKLSLYVESIGIIKLYIIVISIVMGIFSMNLDRMIGIIVHVIIILSFLISKSVLDIHASFKFM